MITTKKVVSCDGQCGADPVELTRDERIPSTWSVFERATSNSGRETKHLCPRCAVIVFAALWHERARGAVIAAAPEWFREAKP